MKNRKTGWKIYFFILSFLLLIAYFDIFRTGATLFDFVDVIISLIALLGLFGYSFQRKIYEKKLWQIWLFVIIIWDVIYNLLLTHTLGVAQNSIKLSLGGYIFNMLTLLPEYFALYFYGYQSSDLWNDHNNAIHSDGQGRGV
jgi:hypothetical protein